jgi:hypothetical protein
MVSCLHTKRPQNIYKYTNNMLKCVQHVHHYRPLVDITSIYTTKKLPPLSLVRGRSVDGNQRAQALQRLRQPIDLDAIDHGAIASDRQGLSLICRQSHRDKFVLIDQSTEAVCVVSGSQRQVWNDTGSEGIAVKRYYETNVALFPVLETAEK